MAPKPVKRFARFAPLVISALALALVIEGALQFGHHPPQDEGLHAHVFQILMVLELPALIAFFSVLESWRKNISIFATHAILWFAALATLRFYIEA